jgi:hypothetical protein
MNQSYLGSSITKFKLGISELFGGKVNVKFQNSKPLHTND